MVDRPNDAKIREREKNKREHVEAEWNDFVRLKRKYPRHSVREACIDRARLDIVEWLRRLNSSRQESSTTPPDDVEPTDTITPRKFDKQIRELAHVLAEDVLDEINRDPEFADSEVRKALAASHFWCDLFIALAVTLQGFQDSIEEVPNDLKEKVKTLLAISSKHDLRETIGDYLVGKLVDKAWEKFMLALKAKIPLLAAMTNPQTVRALRILAFLACPDPKRHKEVREKALKPLEEDVIGALKSETGERLKRVFDDWAEISQEPGQ